jgi:ATP-dependent protease ClpP protease subunit
MCACCIARLLVFATEAPGKSILLQINSSGGPLVNALQIISTMNGVHSPIATHVGGVVEGSAVALAAHGLRGFRTAAPGARFSLKALSEELGTGGEEARSLAILAEVLAADTRQGIEEVTRWIREGAEFTASKAVEVGLVDQVTATALWPPARS